MSYYEKLQKGMTEGDQYLPSKHLRPDIAGKYAQIYYHQHTLWVCEIIEVSTNKLIDQKTTDHYVDLLDVMQKQKDQFSKGK